MDKIKVGRVAYAIWCDDEGKVMDDGTIFRLIRMTIGYVLMPVVWTGLCGPQMDWMWRSVMKPMS